MFSRTRQHKRTGSSPSAAANEDRGVFQSNLSAHNLHDAPPTIAPVYSPTASPLGVDFDFDLAPASLSGDPSSTQLTHDPTTAPSVGNFSRPRTSDGGNTPRKSTIGLNPPVLPPIPRVASRYEKDRSQDGASAPHSNTARRFDFERNTPMSDRTNVKTEHGPLKPRLSFEHPLDLLSLSPQDTAGMQSGINTATLRLVDNDINNSPKMESSLFPSKPEPAVKSATENLPTMSRSFIDSRDKPYSQPVPKPFVRTTNLSTPDLLASRSAVEAGSSSMRPPATRLRSQQSTQSLASRTTSTGLSGTTARPSTQASLLSGGGHTTPTITIGTPYSETSSSFPAPERVSTRPRGANNTSNVAGVAVPTHYSSSSAANKTDTKSGDGKKRGRLLNPMSVFQRRKSGQDADPGAETRTERQAQAQALARQKDVVAGGVSTLPADFDPSIKGKLVHDFSAPRTKRNTFGEFEPTVVAQLQSSMGTPSPPADAHSSRSSSLPHNQAARDSNSRLSARTPVFKEHLNEEADASGRINSIHAENLENKDFLKRASMHSNSNYSQDSTMLPPFARRSQVLDPAQATLYQENDSKRSSDRSADKGQDSSLSSVHLVSPVMAHYDSQGGASDFRRSISPVSPSTPNLPTGPPSPGYANVAQQGSSQTYGSATLTPRPVSGILALPTRDSVAGSSSPASPIPVSPIEPYVPVNASSTRQDNAQNSPLQLTPPARDEGQQQPAVSAPSAPSSAAPPSSPGKKLVLDESAGFPTPDRTPEPEQRVSQASHPPSQPKKRASAGARSKRAFSGPKHHGSTASRFSFQYASGESAAEEHALEDKHRKLAKRGQTALSTARGPSPDGEEDEDDYFDEDAMDDLDEMEMQDQEPYDQLPEHTTPPMPTQGLASMQQAREMLQTADSDDSDYDEEGDTSNITDERLLPYADHPAYRTHSAIMTPHTSMNPGSTDAYWRGSTVDNYLRDSTAPQRPRNTSSASALTVNTNVGPFGSTGVSKPNPNPYMQPASLDKTGLAQRDDRSRVVSGMSFSSASDATRSPPRGGSGSWAIRGGSRGQNMHAHAGGAGVLPGQAISPPLSQGEGSSVGGASRAASGFSSVRSLRSPKPDQTMQSEHSSPNAQPRVTSPAFSSPGEREVFGNYPSPVSVKGHSSASPQRVAAAGLGLNTLSRSDYDDSPTIPFPVAQPNEPKGWQKSGLSVAMVPSDSQGVDGQDMHAVPSPPATAEMRGTGSFGSDVRGMQSPHSSWQSNDHLLSTNLGQVSARGNSGKAEDNANTFSDFNFNDSASPVKNDGSIPLHGTQILSAGPVSMGVNQLEVANSSAMYHGDVGRGLQVRSQQSAHHTSQRPSAPLTSDADDDMYYDDGNFHDEDMHGLHGDSIDESAFDNDTFLNSGSAFHRRDDSNMSANSMGSDGPYPFFAMPNAAKARQRDSQLMLEDLPLQDAVDPKLIPRRNPSEDAKRLGMSSRVPPLPVAVSNTEAFAHMQADLQQYHATLADAANRAAADGRFLRAPSISTARSPSGASSKYLGEDSGHFSRDTQSMYSNGEDGAGGGAVFDFDGNGVNRAPSYQTTSSQFAQKSYSPQRMNFDFGFDPAPNDDEYDMNDDDLVAAANAEALASDDEGFYGQEFHFYGRPRSNSGEVNPMHGGYFGEDGDDGLARNRSLKEPNLTPITERSEFSTRNSFIGMGQPFSAGGIPGSAGPFGPHSPALARLPVSPWTENDITSFDQLRKLRANAFGDSTTSLNSSNRSSAYSQPGGAGGHSPGTAHALPRPNYLGSGSGGAPMMHGSSNDSSGSSNPASASFTFPGNTNAGSSTILSPTALYDSPVSAPASASAPAAVSSGMYAGDHDSTLLATPKRSSLGHAQTGSSPEAPLTARKLPLQTPSSPAAHTHSRKSSSNSAGGGGAADSVTYVREQDPEGSGKPRWVLERRRTSSQGQLELVGRELVQGGWI